MTRKKKRQAKDFERYFTKNVVYKQPICTQNSAHLLVIKEIQIKITRYISIHTMKMAKIRLTTPNLARMWNKIYNIVGGNVQCYIHSGKHFVNFLKSKYICIIWSHHYIPTYLPKRKECVQRLVHEYSHKLYL